MQLQAAGVWCVCVVVAGTNKGVVVCVKVRWCVCVCTMCKMRVCVKSVQCVKCKGCGAVRVCVCKCAVQNAK